MLNKSRLIGLTALVLLAVCAATAAADDRSSIVIVFKDGHHQSFAMTEITRIDFKAPAVFFRDGHQEKIAAADIDRIEFGSSAVSAAGPGRAHFIGKWEAGDGNGHNFYITLEADGTARKSIGPAHGTWTLVDSEARINWDDGWRDVICKVGAQHEKRAYASGKSFDDKPSNVTTARKTQSEPI